MPGTDSTDVLVTISLALYKQLLKNSPTLTKIDKILGVEDGNNETKTKKRFLKFSRLVLKKNIRSKPKQSKKPTKRRKVEYDSDSETD